MEHILVYRNRHVTQEDIYFINRLIADNPGDGRSALSRKICHAWNWVQPNGHLKDMICRGFLLRLEKEGYIELPARKGNPPPNPFLHRTDPQPVEVEETPIEGTVKGLYPITFLVVKTTKQTDPTDQSKQYTATHYQKTSEKPPSSDGPAVKKKKKKTSNRNPGG